MTQDGSETKIEKTTLLRAPLGRVWQAISDSSQFGEWFGLRAEGPFVAGETVRCSIVPTAVDPEVAEKQKEFEGYEFDVWVEEIVPERRLSLRWHPYAIDEDADPETEPTTLVTFEMEEQDGGVRLRITESGFDKIPLDRRAKAFSANEDGWTHQIHNIEIYVASN